MNTGPNRLTRSQLEILTRMVETKLPAYQVGMFVVVASGGVRLNEWNRPMCEHWRIFSVQSLVRQRLLVRMPTKVPSYILNAEKRDVIMAAVGPRHDIQPTH